MLGMTLPPCCPYQPRRSVSPHQSLATIHAAFARKVRARPSGCSTLEAIWVHLRYGPVTRSPSLRDGFVNRLQDYQFPSFLLFKLRGSGLLPRWDSHPLFMPAFAGRTLPGTNIAKLARSPDQTNVRVGDDSAETAQASQICDSGLLTGSRKVIEIMLGRSESRDALPKIEIHGTGSIYLRHRLSVRRFWLFSLGWDVQLYFTGPK